jgi:hypothetical protein
MEDSKTAPSIQVALLARALAECAGPEDRQVMVRDTMASLARRAFRRPIDALEADRMLEVFSQADGDCDDAEAGIRGALVDVLTSPRFLYRMEPAASETADAFALASRLSFFLWASVPDDELLREAEQGTLLKNLEAQTRRMVKAPPARDLPARIGNIWLGLDSLGSADPTDASLVKAMRTETEKLIEVVMHEDRPVTEFLDADYTYVNQRLAEHYGIRGIQGDGWQRVSLRGTHRAGLWTHASVLRISTGGAELTSPVQRGKWILENLVGQPVPRPPAGLLETLAKPDTKSNAKQASFREQTERHRADPSCAQCHIKMDAIGLSLENFDGRGAWRSRYPEGPVDATGVLSDKETLHGPDDTKAYLLRHSSDLVKAISGKLLANALGRKLNQYDRSGLPEIAENVAGDSYRFSRMIVEIVQSPAFLRGGQPSATAKN